MERSELLENVDRSHARLLRSVEGLADEDASRAGVNPRWSAKDVLAHVIAWEHEGARAIGEMLDGTYRPVEITRELIDGFNERAVEERRGRTLEELLTEAAASHEAILRTLGRMPDEIDESGQPYQFARLVTVNHYEHHAGQIEEWRKRMANEE